MYLEREGLLPEMEAEPDDNTIICRCEEITKGEIRQAIHDGMYTMNEIKRYLRPGMGLCQGQSCSLHVKRILAKELHIPMAEVEECTARAPMRPITLEEASRVSDDL